MCLDLHFFQPFVNYKYDAVPRVRACCRDFIKNAGRFVEL